MRPIDFAKAAGTATIILALNVIVSILAVFAYSVIEPGHPQAFYDAAAFRIAPWCSYIAGTALCFGAGYLGVRWQPRRNGLHFAAAFTLFYAIIDAAMVGFVSILDLHFVASMFVKLFAAVGGSYLAQHQSRSKEEQPRV